MILKNLLLNLVEVYPSNIDYFKKILLLIKYKIKPSTLYGFCEYFSKVKLKC